MNRADGDAVPAAIYQVRYRGDHLWQDTTEAHYERAGNDGCMEARIVYSAPPIPVAAKELPTDRYRVERNHSGFWPYKVLCATGTRELFIGHKTACERVAAELTTAFFDGAFVAAPPTSTSADAQAPIAWRARGYAQFKTGMPSEWRYYDGATKPTLNKPECCDIEPLGVLATPLEADAQAPVAPKGWKLVPIVPTDEMIQEGSDSNPTCWNDTTDNGFPLEVAKYVYTAMLAAAPIASALPAQGFATCALCPKPRMCITVSDCCFHTADKEPK